MSSISRRDLLRVFRPGGAPKSTVQAPTDERSQPPSFSLDAFYAGRSASSAIPAFAVTPAAVPTPTTRVGLGRITGFESDPEEASSASVEVSEVVQLVAIASAMVPKVLSHRCLATTSFCSVCLERCPIDGAIVVALGRPRVDASRCDGCGRCIAACPAPILAFELVPRDPPL